MPGTVWLTNKATGVEEPVATEDVAAALQSGRYHDPGAIAVNRQGLNTYVTPDVARRDALVAPAVDPALLARERGHQLREQENSGIGATAKAGLGGVVGGLSAGLISPFEDAQEFHPIASGIGQVVGAVAPALVGDEAGLLSLTPAGLISRTGGAVAEGLGGGLAARTAAGAVEGALYGAGSGVHDLAVSEDPLTVDRVASAISSNMIYGAGLGAGLSLAAKGVEAGLGRAQRALADIADRAAPVSLAEAATAGTEGSGVELSKLDDRGLKAARKAELAQIDQERVPQRHKLVDDLNDFRDNARDSQLFKAAQDSGDRDVREAGASLRKADFAIRGALDNRALLAEDPGRVLSMLQRQEQALTEIHQWGIGETQKLDTSLKAEMDMRARIQSGELRENWDPKHLTDRGLDFAVQTELKRAGDHIPSAKFDVQKLAIIEEKYPAAIEANRALQRRIGELTADPTSPRLAAIDEARESLGLPKDHTPSLGGVALSAAAHAVGPIGTLAAASGHAVGALRRAGAAAAKHSSEALAAFLNVSNRVTPKLAGPGAAAILSSVSFARGKRASSSGDLETAYKARTAELRELTHVAPDGSIQMRPERRMEITKALAPVAMRQPILADRIETSLARRIAYMSSKIPKRPEVGSLQVGPDNWKPSELAMRSWARTVRACEDPDGVEDRLAHGLLTPEDAEAYRYCYPARLAALRDQVFTAARTLSRTLSTPKKVQLYTLTGVPTMPALQPNVLAVLQASFKMEANTAGGTAAPKPMPAFGALGSPRAAENEATPAQRRAAK